MFLRMQAQVTLSPEADTMDVQISSRYFDQVSSKANQIEQKLDKKTSKAVQQLAKKEEKIQRKLHRLDSTKAKEIFGNRKQTYKDLEQRLQGKLPVSYLSSLDTTLTSLKFLQQNPKLISQVKDGSEKLKEAMNKVSGLESQFQKAEEIKRFLKERKQFLKEQLTKIGFAKELKKINKQVYYYNQQINEYKEILKDSKKAEAKAIELLSKTKLFRDFMKKNSQFAALFGTQGNDAGMSAGAGFAALQTRVQVNNFLQQTAGINNNSVGRLQQNIQSAEAQLTQLRNQISRAGGNSKELEMPGFRPNSQKTKSFFKRLEYGSSVQSQKASHFFPATSDIGLSVGYKLNDRSIVGIGASYKLGLGKGWNNIKVSHEGIGIRSFVDWKIKGSFWLSGGYEQNYKAQLSRVLQVSPSGGDLEGAWQQSGLLGVSKVVSLKSKFLKKTRLQLLWDFLSYRQKPVTQPLLFRVGYNF